MAARCVKFGVELDAGPNVFVCPRWINARRINRTTGGWLLHSSTCYLIDTGLVWGLLELWNGTDATIADVGAGVGCYTHALRHAGLSVIAAYDAAPNIERITRGVVVEWDATQPLPLPHPPDWMLSLEVAEHVPRDGTQAFVRNLAAARCGAVVSWAPPGQRGKGHVNGHTPHAVAGLFRSFDMHLDHNRTQLLRSGAGFPWFKSNVMLFRHAHTPWRACDVPVWTPQLPPPQLRLQALWGV